MKKTIFNLKNKVLGRDSNNIFEELKRNENLSREELDLLTLAKIKKLIIHAKENVPYYRRVYKDINVEKLVSLSDIEKLPLLTKEDIRKYSDELISEDITGKQLKMVTTGGSTGAPLKVYHDRRNSIDIIGWRALNWWGVSPFDNVGFIYRKVRVGFLSFVNKVLWFPTRRTFLDASMLNSHSMSNFYKTLQKTKPSYLQGYVGAVNEFANYCIDNNLQIKSIKAVWVTSAPLNENQRKKMEQAFSAPVYDQYGCSEVFWLATECEQRSGLHVFSDFRHLEIVNDDGSNCPCGTLGKITITDLENYAFPLIRYVNGDVGRLLGHICECGRTLPLIDKVKGRVTDMLKLIDGSVISGDYMTTIFDNYPEAVLEFQIHQKSDMSIQFHCVLADSPDAKEKCRQAVNTFIAKVSEKDRVDLFFVEKIDHDQGKTRFIISELL